MSVNKLILNEFELYSKATANTENCSLKKIIFDKNSDHLINQHTQAQITTLDVNTFNKANEQIFDNLDIEKIPDALYIWAAIK